MKSLRAKLIALVLVAILPAIIAVGWLLAESLATARHSASRAFVQMAEMAALSIEGITRGAARVGLAYVNNPDFTEPARCAALLEQAGADYPDYAGFVVLSGGVPVCQRIQPGITTPAAALDAAAAMTPGSRPLFGWVNRRGGILLWTVVRSTVPGRDLSVIVLVADEILRRTSERVDFAPDTSFHLVRLDGTVLNAGAPGEALPRSVVGAIPEDDGSGNVIAALVGGEKRLYSIQSRPQLGVAVVVGRPQQLVFGDNDWKIVLAIVAPLLLLLSAVITIWVGLERLVLRWLRRLQGVARAYAAGGITARCGPMPSAPDEVAQFGRSFDGMADSIASRTVDLETEIAQKRRYIRELHHRVKNNLQVITSMLALQRRHLPEGQRAVLRFPEERINAMSAAYRAAYAHSETGDIDVIVLVAEVIARLKASAADRGLTLHQEIDASPTQISLDEAVALSMLLAELLPPRFDHAVTAGQPMTIRLRCEAPDLVITMPAEAGRQAEHPLSRRFIDAYLRQLAATLATEGDTLTLRVPVARS